jgi:hypothetical protein
MPSGPGERYDFFLNEVIKNSRDLVVLFTRDYEQSPYTRMELECKKTPPAGRG